MANILPLESKYYGTIVDLGECGEIKVWLEPKTGSNYKVSDRQSMLGWEPEDGYDHRELDVSYEVAMIIAEALTKAGY